MSVYAIFNPDFSSRGQLLASILASLAMATSQSANAAAPSSGTALVETRTLEIGGNTIAYRDLGPKKGVPLLLINRFRGTMDNWDPKLIDKIATERRVVMFDQPGFARSTGTPPDNLAAFASTFVEVANKLGIDKFDVLGFSMGGTVALQLVLDQPARVRRAVVAGSVPGYVPGDVPSNKTAGNEVWSVATKPVNSDEDFLFLFFEPTETSQKAGREYLARLTKRKDAHLKHVDAVAWQAQLKSAFGVKDPETTLLSRLKEIKHPVFVANGRHDIMAPTYASYAMVQELPNGWLKVYPDSGHGFLFQHADEFGEDVLRFLR